MNYSGDAFLNWHTKQITIPTNGSVVGSAVETDLSLWPDYDGEIPKPEEQAISTFAQAVIYNIQKWDNNKDNEVPDLSPYVIHFFV